MKPTARGIALFAAVTALAGCGLWPFGRTASPQTAWFHTLRERDAAGKDAAVSEQGLTPFQKSVRARIVRGVPGIEAPQETWLLEADRPGDEAGMGGAYLAVYAARNDAILQYFEQAGHLPRNDRLYHRHLSAEELAEVRAFFKSHPLEQLTTAPATRPAEAALATPLFFRLTHATSRQGRTTVFQEPPDAHSPAAQAVLLFSRLRDAGAGRWNCLYERQIPANARILFADPQHAVVGAWVRGDDIRARIVPPLGAPPSQEAEPRWYRLVDGAWKESDVPPIDAQAGPPLPPDDARVPEVETWRVDPQDGYTNVWHFRPAGRAGPTAEGEWKGFVVPGLEFDASHMHVESDSGLLFAIHQGHLVAFPVPAAAR